MEQSEETLLNNEEEKEEEEEREMDDKRESQLVSYTVMVNHWRVISENDETQEERKIERIGRAREERIARDGCTRRRNRTLQIDEVDEEEGSANYRRTRVWK